MSGEKLGLCLLSGGLFVIPSTEPYPTDPLVHSCDGMGRLSLDVPPPPSSYSSLVMSSASIDAAMSVAMFSGFFTGTS